MKAVNLKYPCFAIAAKENLGILIITALIKIRSQVSCKEKMII